MTVRKIYTLIYAPAVKEHLRAIEPKYYSLIRQKIEEQLFYEPDAETENRKLLIVPNVLEAIWEIRFGPNNRFRVFYAVDRAAHEVQILAIGVKVGNRLRVGQEEIEL